MELIQMLMPSAETIREMTPALLVGLFYATLYVLNEVF